MSDMLKDGASGGARPLPPNESHDEFLELCATATTGTLSAEERRRLRDHLSHCESCREVMAQYEAIVERVIPGMSPLSAEKNTDPPGWSQESAEARLFERLRESEQTPADEYAFKAAFSDSKLPISIGKPAPSEEALWRHMWVQFAAAVMLVAALGLMAYRIGKRRGADTAARASTLPISKPMARSVGVPEASGSEQGLPANRGAEQVEALQSELQKRLSEIDHLKAQQVEIQNQLSVDQADRIKVGQDRATLAEQLKVAQQNLEATQQKLDSLASRSSQESARNDALQQTIDELNQNMGERDQEIARERELLDHDRDIRELMGSRDLYIAEVYDVAKTGNTEKPFGRVFYTKGKSLIFYAYDLDQHSGLKPASIFQAWGRRGPDRDRAVNLGILYEDNTAKKRWVLKSANAKTLAEIDAVFVTVEPNGGSPHPSGKPLLFAYLGIQPNHP